jgi:GNAT superfamily N-acetyltransferase
LPERPGLIRGPLLGQGGACGPILRALPEWFGIETAREAYVEAISGLPTWLAGDRGFVTVKRHFPAAAEIYVMGVRPEAHRRGVGRALLQAAEVWLVGEGVRLLQVKTLAGSSAYEPYARTRAFYQSQGFLELEELPRLWDEGNPCLLLVKVLA